MGLSKIKKSARRLRIKGQTVPRPITCKVASCPFCGYGRWGMNLICKDCRELGYPY